MPRLAPRVAAALLALLLAVPAVPVVAQDAYPSKPVRFILPFPATGPLDVMVRIVAEKMGASWGQPVIVENKPGATGAIGAAAVAQAAPDGYTLLFSVDIPLTMRAAVPPKPPYDPLADFKPIANVARTSNALFVNPAVGADTVAALIARAKAEPGRLTYSSAGIASPAHFAAALFADAAGIDMTHVPYKGAAPAMVAAVSGEVSLMFGPITQGLPHVRGGKMKALAVTGPGASPLLPGVKPFTEIGFPAVVVTSWYPVMAPAKTPDAIVAKIRAELKKAMDDPAVRERLVGMGIEVGWEGPEQVTKNIADDVRRWGEVAKRANMRLE